MEIVSITVGLPVGCSPSALFTCLRVLNGFVAWWNSVYSTGFRSVVSSDVRGDKFT